jgi:hypothetical protein
MKTQTRSVVAALLLALCAGVVGIQAWRVGYIWLDMFYFGPSILVSPWWLVERALFTLLAFYPIVVILRLLHRQPIWFICLLGLIALGLCFTGLFVQTFWALPAFIGIHVVAVTLLVFHFIAAQRHDYSADAHENPI